MFPVDIDSTITSQHHPWACSLKTRGFRGRHRCGVTLLSGEISITISLISSIVYIVYILGPTVDSPDDPYVLVGAAHCNHICKDRLTGHVLETCCCRPPSDPGSCAQVILVYFGVFYCQTFEFRVQQKVTALSARAALSTPWRSPRTW